jgi:fibronectin type 3 domain-containing protein
MNVVPGHRYFYTVTAVDRAGNESTASSAVSGELPGQPAQVP